MPNFVFSIKKEGLQILNRLEIHILELLLLLTCITLVATDHHKCTLANLSTFAGPPTPNWPASGLFPPGDNW